MLIEGKEGKKGEGGGRKGEGNRNFRELTFPRKYRWRILSRWCFNSSVSKRGGKKEKVESFMEGGGGGARRRRSFSRRTGRVAAQHEVEVKDGR